jgi:hypothetical protein
LITPKIVRATYILAIGKTKWLILNNKEYPKIGGRGAGMGKRKITIQQ